MEDRFESHYTVGVLDPLPKPKPRRAAPRRRRLRRRGPAGGLEAAPRDAFALRGCVLTPDQKHERSYVVVEGDTVTAVVAVLLAAGATVEEAAVLANHAAAIEVSKAGVATVSPEEIRAAVLRLSLAALASTVTMGSLLFLAAWSPEPYNIPIFGIFGAITLWMGMSLFGALGIHVLFARFLDLRVWRSRLYAVVRFFSWRRDR